MPQYALSKQQAETVTRRSTLADGSHCFRTCKFTQLMTQLAPGSMLLTGIGYNSGESTPLITAELARAIPVGGKLNVFVNLSRQTGQAKTAHQWWADWVKLNRAQLNTTHIFVSSRLMDMAVSVLVMIVGGGIVSTHSSLKSFEAAIAERVRGFRGLPSYPDLPPQLE